MHKKLNNGYALSVMGAACASVYILCNKFVYNHYDIDTIHYTAVFLIGAGLVGIVDLGILWKRNNIFQPNILESKSKHDSLKRALFNGIIASIGMALIVMGQKNTSAANASIIFASVPIPTAIFARLILKIALRKKQFYAFPIFLIGLYVAVVGFEVISLQSGDILVFAGATCIGFTNAFSRTAMDHMTSYSVNSIRSVIGIFIAILIYIVTLEFGTDSLLVVMLALIAGALYWLATRLIYAAISSIGPNDSIILVQLHVVFTPIAAAFLLDEKYYLHIALGSIVMLIGTYIFTHIRSNRPVEATIFKALDLGE